MVENMNKPAIDLTNKVDTQAPLANDANTQKTHNTSEDSANIPEASAKMPGTDEKGQTDPALI